MSEIRSNQPSATNKLLKLVNLVYRRIFHEEMSVEVMAFLKNVLYIGAANLDRQRNIAADRA